MVQVRHSAVLAALVLTSACASRREAPAPTPTPVFTPPARSPALPPPSPAPGWEDAALSPGDWTLVPAAGGSPVAEFRNGGAAVLRVVCEAPQRIAIIRTGPGGGALTLRATSGERSIPATPGPGGVVARVPAGDPLLDALVFSRGRFAVDMVGAARLILPSWPEPARVIEDCRG